MVGYLIWNIRIGSGIARVFLMSEEPKPKDNVCLYCGRPLREGQLPGFCVECWEIRAWDPRGIGD